MEAVVRTPVAALQAYGEKSESGLSTAIGAEYDRSAAAKGFWELDCLDSPPFATIISNQLDDDQTSLVRVRSLDMVVPSSHSIVINLDRFVNFCFTILNPITVLPYDNTD